LRSIALLLVLLGAPQNCRSDGGDDDDDDDDDDDVDAVDVIRAVYHALPSCL